MLASSTYLENEVLTATPQKLRLLLIDGAIRFAHAAIRHWETGSSEDACEAIIRCRSIVTELFSVIDDKQFGPAARVHDLYLFLFGELTQAQAHHSSERMQGVIRILEEERETWRQLCLQLPEAPVAPRHFQPKEITASNFPANVASQSPALARTAGFSLDA